MPLHPQRHERQVTILAHEGTRADGRAFPRDWGGENRAGNCQGKPDDHRRLFPPGMARHDREQRIGSAMTKIQITNPAASATIRRRGRNTLPIPAVDTRPDVSGRG